MYCSFSISFAPYYLFNKDSIRFCRVCRNLKAVTLLYNPVTLTCASGAGRRIQEFFNEKEKRHMNDVKELFLAAERLRTQGLWTAALAGLLLLWRRQIGILLRTLQWGVGLFLAAVGTIAFLAAASFTKYFTWFHLLLFDNNDWLLNPATDRLINILPEGFFRDTAFFIAGIFLAAAFLLWLAARLLDKRFVN